MFSLHLSLTAREFSLSSASSVAMYLLSIYLPLTHSYSLSPFSRAVKRNKEGWFLADNLLYFDWFYKSMMYSWMKFPLFSGKAHIYLQARQKREWINLFEVITVWLWYSQHILIKPISHLSLHTVLANRPFIHCATTRHTLPAKNNMQSVHKETTKYAEMYACMYLKWRQCRQWWPFLQS